jgi:hypothetical protein
MVELALLAAVRPLAVVDVAAVEYANDQTRDFAGFVAREVRLRDPRDALAQDVLGAVRGEQGGRGAEDVLRMAHEGVQFRHDHVYISQSRATVKTSSHKQNSSATLTERIVI